MKAILTYHSVDATGSVISIDPAAFRRHVTWLASGIVRVVPLAELATLPADADAVALTFDDGFRNFADVAAPLLLDHGLAATVFVVSDAVGGSNAWRGGADEGVPVLPLLDWDALGRLAERGIAIGAHTRTHPRLAGHVALDDEVAGSRARITSELGLTPSGFAYPYGSHDAAAVACAARHFTHACTTELRLLAGGDDPHRLPRLDTFYLRAPGRLEAWGTARFAGALHVRAAMRRVRQLVTPNLRR